VSVPGPLGLLYVHKVCSNFAFTVNSNSSVGSTKYDPDLLKADVNLAKNRVSRLKHELEQIRAEMHYKEQGVETLARYVATVRHVHHSEERNICVL